MTRICKYQPFHIHTTGTIKLRCVQRTPAFLEDEVVLFGDYFYKNKQLKYARLLRQTTIKSMRWDDELFHLIVTLNYKYPKVKITIYALNEAEGKLMLAGLRLMHWGELEYTAEVKYIDDFIDLLNKIKQN